MDNDNLTEVGQYIDQFNTLTGLTIPTGPIYLSDGLEQHIRGRHPNCVQYIPNIAEIIAHPDYIGHHPQEPNSIELVKVLEENIQVAIKLDANNHYLYVASLYDISQGKIDRRLNSGRLKRFA